MTSKAVAVRVTTADAASLGSVGAALKLAAAKLLAAEAKSHA